MTQKEQKMQEPEIIGIFIEGKDIVVANPCTIPIELIEDTIKNHKKTKVKGVTGVFGIEIPFKFK